jgi:hypothetical protein
VKIYVIIAGCGIYYDKFKIQNTKSLWLVNSNKVLCRSFNVYPSYVAGIINSVNKVNIFVLHSEQINYAD